MKMQYVIMFKSRNKDNKDVANFKQRSKCFFARPSKNAAEIYSAFEKFVAEGVPGEVSRYYMSINARNMEKTQNMLIAKLALEDCDLTKIEPITIGLAMQPGCAAEKHWLFDIDTKIPEEVIEIRGAINEIMAKLPQDKRPEIIAWTETPNGFHLIVEHGFDTRELMAAYSEKVSLKRDDFTILKWLTKS